MNRVAAYRSYAAECLALAGKTVADEERHILIEMAVGWHELAVLLESYRALHNGEELPVSELDLPTPPRRSH